MEKDVTVRKLDNIVVLFSGDSGDGMQLAGNIFSSVCALQGNDICTFPDYPAEIRAPQGTLSGVSGFKVHAGKNVTTPGNHCNILVAMNPAALKREKELLNPDSVIIIDNYTFTESELKKAEFNTDSPFEELGIKNEVISAPLSQMCLSSLKKFDMPAKEMLKCRNMMALGLICWMVERPLEQVEQMIQRKFAKKPQVAEANIRVLRDGYNYGQNIHANTCIRYKIQSKKPAKGVWFPDLG